MPVDVVFACPDENPPQAAQDALRAILAETEYEHLTHLAEVTQTPSTGYLRLDLDAGGYRFDCRLLAPGTAVVRGWRRTAR